MKAAFAYKAAMQAEATANENRPVGLIQPAHRRLQVAPMMELTDRHFRWLARRLSRHTLLWTEMLTSAAVINGDRDYLLGFDSVEHPCVLQLGGSDPGQMAEAAAIGESYGYGEINMNVGCPSDRVQAGRFGACLMAEPALVAGIVSRMADAVRIPVTVKCRLGIDRDDSYEALERFVETVAAAGVGHFIVHARKAWLDGLSPKENRSIPPLRHEYVHRLKRSRPDLHITINGGISEWRTIESQLELVDGVMIGRAGYYHVAMLGAADARVFADLEPPRSGRSVEENGLDRQTACRAFEQGVPDTGGGLDTEALAFVARDYASYMQDQIERGVRPSTLTRHLVSLIQEVPGARQFRRVLSEGASRTSDVRALVDAALDPVESAAYRATRRSA